MEIGDGDPSLTAVLDGHVAVHRVEGAVVEHLNAVKQAVLPPRDVRGRGNADLGEVGLRLAIRHDVDRMSSNPASRLATYRPMLVAEGVQEAVAHVRAHVERTIAPAGSRIDVTGHAVYPPGGCMGWHSNHTRPGLRVYCTWAELEGESFFRILDAETMRIGTLWEPAGWSIRSFSVPESPDRLWHCIGTNCHRVSLGFRAAPDATR